MQTKRRKTQPAIATTTVSINDSTSDHNKYGMDYDPESVTYTVSVPSLAQPSQAEKFNSPFDTRPRHLDLTAYSPASQATTPKVRNPEALTDFVTNGFLQQTGMK